MFGEIEKALRPLLADKQLNYSDSYFPNGNLYYIEKDARKGCMTLKFSLLSTRDFETLVQAIKRTISDYGFTYKEIEEETQPINRIWLEIYKKL